MSSSFARIQLTIEVSNSGSYGPEWRVGDLEKQARKEALEMVKSKLAQSGVKIIGEPKVLIITHISD